MSTIRDVAKAAKVSASTVSRVMNASGAVSSRTAEKVQTAIKELGFVPNSLARNFANQSTQTVAVVINIENPRAYSNPFFSEVLHGIETVIYPAGYLLVIANEKTFSHHQLTLGQLVREKRIDGLILPSSVLVAKLVRTLEREDFPFVVLGEPDEQGDAVDFVDINNALGGQQSVLHLVENGYRRIAYVGGSRADRFNQHRLRGYREALNACGLSSSESLIAEETAEITKESGYRLAQGLLSLPDPPDAFVCTDNILAWGVMRAVRAGGHAIPTDCGIVSFDNFPLADFLEPALTTVDIDVFALGVQAAGMLLKRMHMGNLPHQQSLIATQLIVRESSARGARR